LTATGSSTNSAVAQPNFTFNPNTQLLSLTGSMTISGTPSGNSLTINTPAGQVFSIGDVTLIGDSQVPSLYTTKKVTLSSGNNSIYSFATASYTGAFVDYTLSSGGNARSGNLMAIWNGGNLKFTDNSTLDIGTTNGVTFSFIISGTYAVLQASADASGWIVKTILRSI